MPRASSDIDTPERSPLPPASQSSFVYPVRSLLTGKIQPAPQPDEASDRPVVARKQSISSEQGHATFTQHEVSAHGAALNKERQRNSPSEALSDVGDSKLTLHPIGDDSFDNNPILPEQRGDESQSSSLPDSESLNPTKTTSTLSKQKKRKIKHKRNNFRHFPADDTNEDSTRSFSMAPSHFEDGCGRPVQDNYTSLGHRMTDPFTAESASTSNLPLPLVAASALSATSHSLLPTPPAAATRADGYPWREAQTTSSTPSSASDPTPTIAETLGTSSKGNRPTHSVPASTPIDIPKSTPLQEDTPADSESIDEASEPIEEVGPLPFNLSQYGIVHLPPLLSSRSNSELTGSPALSHRHQSIGSILSNPRSGNSSEFSGWRGSARRNRRLSALGSRSSPSGFGTPSTGNNPSGNSSNSMSNAGSETGPHVTFQFRHVEDADGHHVVVGREGQLQRCEEEVCLWRLFQNCADRCIDHICSAHSRSWSCSGLWSSHCCSRY